MQKTLCSNGVRPSSASSPTASLLLSSSTSSNSTSFRCVNGVPFDERGVSKLVESLVETSIVRAEKKETVNKRNSSKRGIVEVSAAETLKAKRTHYGDSIKQIIEIYDSYENGSKHAAMAMINSINGYEHVTRKSISKWKSALRRPTVKKTRGKKANGEFEDLVMQEYTLVAAIDSAAYSYKIIRSCAERVRNRAYDGVHKFQTDPLTKNLKFSDKWVVGLLRRQKLRV